MVDKTTALALIPLTNQIQSGNREGGGGCGVWVLVVNLNLICNENELDSNSLLLGHYVAI